MRANGHIHGVPIHWHVIDGYRLSATVHGPYQLFLHSRPLEARRAYMGKELWHAYLRREITRAEHELRKRVN